MTKAQRILHHLELPILLLVPIVMAISALSSSDFTGGLTLLAALVCCGFLFEEVERERPTLRQIMPTVCLGALAAAGRILFAAIPDVKPVSAIVILAGACLGPRYGFVTGALAALVSNMFFGQGAWTPLQMYAWGLIGYIAGVLAAHHLLDKRWQLAIAGFLSGLLFGLILNGWYILGYVRPLTWATAGIAFAAGIPFDIVHGIATTGFLLLIWIPWGRSLRRVLARF